jgi:hypothetical protein
VKPLSSSQQNNKEQDSQNKGSPKPETKIGNEEQQNPERQP